MPQAIADEDADRVHPAFFSLGNPALITPMCIIGAVIGIPLIVTLGITTNASLIEYPSYFAHSLAAPAHRVFAATIKAGASMKVARQLLIWGFRAPSCNSSAD